jgi:hypothetical protein
MMNLDKLTHIQKELLSDDCEDFLLHRNIPLRSHSYDSIIEQALKEGYQLSKFDRFVNLPTNWTSVTKPPETASGCPTICL